MNLLTTLRFAFLLTAATWLGLAGAIVPRLFAMEYGQGELAAWHCLILSAVALASIIGLTKPRAAR